ncbi:putative transposase, MuDR, plant, MULE transposase domain protein [Tanacetum coccineum]
MTDQVLSIHYVYKYSIEQSFIKLDSEETFMVMLNMYKKDKAITIYFMTVQVKEPVEKHSCIRSNKGGNKCATQGWIANVLSDKIRFDGDVSIAELRKWLMQSYNADIPYKRVYRGKEQAFSDIYRKREDSFIYMNAYKEELLKRNAGSVVDIAFESDGDKKRFQRLFVSLAACSQGFLAGCRPYIALDACHLKGKSNGVLAAATCIDGNNSIFPIAYSVLESENTSSWTWFLEALRKEIRTLDGLVMASLVICYLE